ncbi:hypothetical protein ACRALDRAFT_1062248 [Sodiomyces alcalophilus JCM 7366]|uniref:uncharacterized protein n=1 Tax=Sodiomyces alcalophilus JCM 7366 TaxID=591952 RepID=UPI0039B40BEA
MRLTWYATISTTLAASVVISAFQQRANFYSAMVYLAQSNVCLLVLTNFVYLIYGTVIFGLQRSLYGPLRQVEVEQLSEKAWFAITETCLAMTIFRDEIGAWFLVMFTALITGKIWGWIGDGRVEILEQQPPANPSLFHTRLVISLLLSLAYDAWILKYSIKTVIQQARPDMMVMFLFEFAVLSTSSVRTVIRYLVSVAENRIIKRQTRQRLEEQRLEARQRREELLRQRDQRFGAGSNPDQAELSHEEDVDEMDVEVPGWENKGQWVLVLDLVADCIKLAIYIVFFLILFSFYGLPIHIMRDLFITARAVVKRVTALWKYRKAIEDMKKYEDATETDITREDTCIICREQMRPWDPRQNPTAIQRVRPKRLPCGHILHMGCLKSWLERQQVCPTCRRSVALTGLENMPLQVARPDQAGPARPLAPEQQAVLEQDQGAQPGRHAHDGHLNRGARVFNLGNHRIAFAQGGDNMRELAQSMARPRQAITSQADQITTTTTVETDPQIIPGFHAGGLGSIADHLMEAERIIQRHLQSLQHDHRQLQVCNLLFAELQRIQQQRQQDIQSGAIAAPVSPYTPYPLHSLPPLASLPHPLIQSGLPLGNSSTVTRHGLITDSNAIPAGSPELPEGIIIPHGWSLLPLKQLDGVPVPVVQSHSNMLPSTAKEQPTSSHTVDSGLPVSTPIAGSSKITSVEDALSRQVPTIRTSHTVNEGEDTFAEKQKRTCRPTRSFHLARLSPAHRAARSEGHEAEILAPSPVTPNWSGENQLFGSGSALSQDARSGTPVWEPTNVNEGATDESGIGGPFSMTTTQDDIIARPRDSVQQEKAVGKEKGKGKAATVEDAKNDDSH